MLDSNYLHFLFKLNRFTLFPMMRLNNGFKKFTFFTSSSFSFGTRTRKLSREDVFADSKAIKLMHFDGYFLLSHG